MRNIFDQYSSPENRLTHALLSCLNEDRKLLHDFIVWTLGNAVRVDGGSLRLYQQGLPGEATDEELADDETDRRGIPDGCILQPEKWTLLIESKVAANPSADQLRRHLATARRKQLPCPRLLLLTIKPFAQPEDASITVRPWRDVYMWLDRQKRAGRWPGVLTRFIEIAEARWAAAGYLKEGTLTAFTGIPFGSKDEPYTYLQAKRLLELLRQDLLANTLVRQLGVDAAHPGRGAITGQSSDRVWDFLALAASKADQNFTQHAHLTVGITRDCLEAFVTVPNAIRSRLRSRLLGGSYEAFANTIERVAENLRPLLREIPVARPKIVVVQRYYPSQRSEPELHCELRFDPRTAFSGSGSAKVKPQPQWLEATYKALRNRKSNLQLQVGVDFPYRHCAQAATPAVTTLVARVWQACRPIIEGVSESSSSAR